MRLERLDLIAYGGFTDRSLDLSAGPRRLHLLYGPNESGKSTALRAITGLLYEIDRNTDDNYLHSYPNLRIGGRFCNDDGVRLDCVRLKRNKNSLLDLDGEPADEAVLARLLAGIDRETFEHQFGLTHPRLVEGGRAITQGDGDLGEILFAAGAGLGTLTEVGQQLIKQQRELFKPSGSIPTINKQLSELNRLRRDLKQALLKPADYKRRCDAHEQIKKQTGMLQQQVSQVRQQHARNRRLLDALPILRKRATLQQRRETFGDVPRLDSDFVERRRDAHEKRSTAESRQRDQRQRLARLEQELAAVEVDPRLEAHRQSIEALNRQLGASQTAARDLVKRQAEADAIRQEIDASLQRLDRQESFDDLQSLRIPFERRERIAALADEVGRLEEKQHAARQQLDDLQEQIQPLETDAAGQSAPVDPAHLASVLEQIGPPAALLEAHGDAQKRVDTLARRAERQRSQLVGFDGTLQQAVGLTPPRPAQIEELADQLRHWQTVREQLAPQQRERRQQLEEIEAELETLKNAQAIPSEAELQDIRQRRDSQLADLKAAAPPDTSTLAAVKDAVARADAMVDVMRREAQRVARRATCEVDAERYRVRLQHDETELQAAQQQYEAAWQQWLRLWQQAGVTAEGPAAMKDWLETLEQLRDIHNDLREAQQQAETAQHKVADATERLSKALAETLSAPAATVPADGEPDLVRLVATARQHHAALQKRFEEHRQAQASLETLRRKLPKAERQLQEQQDQYAQWQRQWRAAIEGIVQSPDVPPSGVKRLIEQIDEILNKKATHDGLQLRIDEIQASHKAFARDVQSLLQTVAPDLLELPADKAVPALIERANSHRDAAVKQRSLQEQVDEAKRMLEQNQRQYDEASDTLRMLADEVGCEQLDDLPELEHQSAEAARLDAELESCDDSLRALASDQPLEAFAQSAEAADAETLQQEADQLGDQLAQLEAELGERQQEQGRLKDDVERMDGSAAAAAIQQKIQDTLARLRRDALQYATLRMADVALHRAIERYRAANQGPILARAEDIFCRLTLNDYTGLRARYDDRATPTLVGVRGTMEVPVNRMSDGAADALYLALRLASLESHVDRRGPFPLILDDILIQLDDDRAAAALEVLSELSEKTQIIFFTHHRHLLEIAAERLGADQFHCHDLHEVAVTS
ncbi:YhaN family protein [Roseimaritima sediminicola]|uniref:YhaN family protein n=1 Tax=Roseimaritima sediminicola TaxID=2662066 RepID=UPI0012984CEA|nr:YhaN family protein [Roseimaritima sediminicola]